MSTYIPLKSQFNADQSFLWKYGLKCTVPRYRGLRSKMKLSLFIGFFGTFLGMHSTIYRWNGNLMLGKVSLETMV